MSIIYVHVSIYIQGLIINFYCPDCTPSANDNLHCMRDACKYEDLTERSGPINNWESTLHQTMNLYGFLNMSIYPSSVQVYTFNVVFSQVKYLLSIRCMDELFF